MSSILKFRVNGYDDIAGDGIEFYFKIGDDNEKVMFNLCIGDDGIYYYPKGAQILAPNENENTISNYKMISMKKLKELFEALRKCDWFGNGEDVDFKINIRGQGLYISESSDEENEKEDD